MNWRPAPAVAAGHGRCHRPDGGGRAAAGAAVGAAALSAARPCWRRWSACRWCCRPPWSATTCCWSWAAAARSWSGSAGASSSPGARPPSPRRSSACRCWCSRRGRPSRASIRALENAARTLGSSELEVLWRVTLPLARRGILAGLVLAAARALGEFGATLMVAGNIPGRTQTLPLAIYDAVQNRRLRPGQRHGAADDRAGFPEPVGGAAFRATAASAHGAVKPARRPHDSAPACRRPAHAVPGRRLQRARPDFRCTCGWRWAPRSWCCSGRRGRARRPR